MILTFAGRLPGDHDFPAGNVAFVQQQVRQIVTNLRPRLVVGSGAAGADLLVLEAALETGANATVVLAGTTAEFRASSVADHGSSWEQRFDTIVGHDHVDVVEVARHPDDVDSYSAVTQVIRGMAEAAADDETIVSLNISAPREGQDHSADLAIGQETRQRLVLRIDPTRAEENTPGAFVAMPFGRRSDPGRGWSAYDADATYQRIILPALIDGGLRPVRADTEALLEVIDLTMLRAIFSAKVVVADLATLNPNVMWEVGVRHAWRRSGTILLRPDGTTPPFDVSHARVHAYARAETGVSDPDAVAGILLVRSLLAVASGERKDSPVFMTLPGLAEPTLPPEREPGAAEHVRRYIETVSIASDLRNADELEQLAVTVEDDGTLEDTSRQALLEQIGLALVAAGRPETATSLLGPLAEVDVALERTRLQQQYAHALIRSDAPGGRADRLERAELRLRALLDRGAETGETYGLLGSAAKARVEQALAVGEAPGAHLAVAIDSYLAGFRLEPGDYYPGIVALALLRLRGQHIAPNDEDIQRSRDLLPVVRFSVIRLGPPDDKDVWRLATAAELALHEYLMFDENDEALVQATGLYARVAVVGGPDHRASAARQLRLFKDAGDPAEVIDALLDVVSSQPPD